MNPYWPASGILDLLGHLAVLSPDVLYLWHHRCGKFYPKDYGILA